MIILIGGEKGGTGKSTLATNMAALRAMNGHDVLLIDADKQGTSSIWSQVRDEGEITPRITCVQKFGKNLAKDTLDLANRYEDIVIDAGGRDSLELRYAMGVAHHMYIPVQPTQFDLWALQNIDSLIEQIEPINSELKAHVVITRSSTNPSVSDTEEALGIISEFERMTILNTTIKERVAYQRCVRLGCSVIEVNPIDKKASNEITNLYKEIYHAN